MSCATSFGVWGRPFGLLLIASLAAAGAANPARSAELNGSNTITTFAGSRWIFRGDGGPALNAPLSQFQQLSTDVNGNIIFADTGNHVVSRLNSDGTLTILAGNGLGAFSGDGGPARSASLNRPTDAVMDSRGNLYIYDSYNNRIRLVTPDGNIQTYAGNGVWDYTGDNGPASQAAIGLNGKMAVASDGTLYFTDPQYGNVRRITPDGTISTYAGNGTYNQHTGDEGPAASASVAINDGGIALDTTGNLYIVEAYTSQIRKVTLDGVIHAFAGTGTAGFGDGPALSATFSAPTGIAIDAAGNIFIGDTDNKAVRLITADGRVITVSGQGMFGFGGDGGPALQAQFRFPFGVALGGDGSLYVSDSGNYRIRRIDASLTINTVAGNGGFRNSPDGTPAASAFLFGPDGIAFDGAGNLLIADTSNGKVERVRTDGTVERVAGIGARGYGFDGVPATQALLHTPRNVAADGQGNIYIVDSYADVVYRVKPDGTLSVFAGEAGFYGNGGDGGAATSADFHDPFGVATDAKGNVYVADRLNNRIRVVSPDGNIHAFAGTGTDGNAGDNGPALQAQLSKPQGLRFDARGNLFIADTGNNAIRKITPDGTITTVAGGGSSAIADGIQATRAQLDGPFDLAVDPNGVIYFLDDVTYIRKVGADGTLSTIAGTGSLQFAGDGGPAAQASFYADGIALDGNGNLYITDFSSDRVRVILASGATLAAAPGSLSFTAVAGGGATDKQGIQVATNLSGYLFAASSNAAWLQAPAGVFAAPSQLDVSADPSGLAAGVYKGAITLLAPGSQSALTTVQVTLTVNSATPPKLAVEPAALSFAVNKGGAAQSLGLRIVNAGSGTLDFSVSEIAGVAGAALSLSTRNGSANAGSPITVTVSAAPGSLDAGTYSGRLTISSGSTGERIFVPVSLTVAGRPQRMQLSQRGLLFTAVQGGGVTPPQTFAVLNAGDGSFSWSAQAIPLGGGSGWLKVSPGAGASGSGSAGGAITIGVDPSGLAAGQYYGIVRVVSKQAANSPQDVEVVLNLLTADNSPGALVGPSGLVFTGAVNGVSPGSQTFQVTNLSPSDAPFSLNTLTLDRGGWLTAAPDHGTIPGGGSIAVTVQPALAGLKPAVYNGSINLLVGDVPRTVSVLFVVAPGGRPGATSVRAADGCAPTKLLPLFTSLLQDFNVPAGWPLPIEVRVVDDCGNPATSGRMLTTFSNGDPQLTLSSLNDGRWQATWFGKNARAAQLTVTVTSDTDGPKLHGTAARTGNLQTNTDVPSVDAGGIKASAFSSGTAVIAPGSLMSIAGKNMAAGPASANQLPLGTDLAGTEVILAGVRLPLLYSSGGLVTAVVPYDGIAADAQYFLLVMRGGSVSGPEMVTVAAAQPSVFRIDASGSAQAGQDIWNKLMSGTPIDPGSVAPSSVSAGQKIVIYCTGLGAVDQTVDPSMPAPAGVNTKNPVTVSIGGQDAAVSFAGLAPGFTGLYQVMATVPGVAAGDGIPVVISTLGQSSAAVNVSVR